MYISTCIPQHLSPLSATLSSPTPPKRAKVDFSLRLPQGNIQVADRGWIGHSLFVKKGELVKLWWHPPSMESSSCPDPGSYHQRRLFLWMPRRMWRVDFHCPHCESSLRSKGLYTNVRLVLDMKDYYYMAAEYMYCARCNGTFIAWDQRMLRQLGDGPRAQFPAVLTRKYACDRSVVSLLRARTLGNSPTALCNNILEAHSEVWMRQQLAFLSDCKLHKKRMLVSKLAIHMYV